MGMLVDGKWVSKSIIDQDKKGHFVRPQTAFRHQITADGSSGFKAEANRYHLYISYACPWAHRTLIMRNLKKLDRIITLNSVDPVMLDKGWKFNEGENSDTINHTQYLSEVYLKADPSYTGKVTTPVLWDKKEQTIVNNESAEIMRMFNAEFNAFTDEQTDYYPEHLRAEIEEVNAFIYPEINNGVYRCGFAQSQEAYNEAFTILFNALEKVENLLGQQPYLAGSQLTEADWRLFVTLIRFDKVYFGHFKCNLKSIENHPNLARYVRMLYQFPGIKATVNFDHIKQHYYRSHLMINPTGIVPQGPLIDYSVPVIS